jgi:hypothetical protein
MLMAQSRAPFPLPPLFRTLTNGTSQFEMHEYVLFRYGTIQLAGVPLTCGVRSATRTPIQ